VCEIVEGHVRVSNACSPWKYHLYCTYLKFYDADSESVCELNSDSQ